MKDAKIYVIVLLCLFMEVDCFSQRNSKKEYIQTDTINTEALPSQTTINLETLELPPLSVLYSNAAKNPSVAILEKEKQLQKRLLSKEKKNWLSFFSARASIAHGVTDNYGTQTDQLTPIFYQYTGIEQTYWNVGGNVNIPIESLLDISGKVKRQKIAVEKAELAKEQAYDLLKQQIATLYVSIQSNIEILKRSSEYMALYKGASATAEQEYRNRRTTLTEVAETKKKEYEAHVGFENMRATIQEQLLVLEIISKTELFPTK